MIQLPKWQHTGNRKLKKFYLQKTSQIYSVGAKPPEPPELVLLFNMTETGLDAEERKVLGPYSRSFLK